MSPSSRRLEKCFGVTACHFTDGLYECTVLALSLRTVPGERVFVLCVHHTVTEVKRQLDVEPLASGLDPNHEPSSTGQNFKVDLNLFFFFVLLKMFTRFEEAARHQTFPHFLDLNKEFERTVTERVHTDDFVFINSVNMYDLSHLGIFI